MQRINSVYDWTPLRGDQQVNIPCDFDGLRLVRLRVNSPAPVALYLTQPNKEDSFFLALVNGLDEIQFNIDGPYTFFTDGGELWWNTIDGVDSHVEAVDPTSFTTIMQRRTRNPELELMEFKMRENQRRMDAIMARWEQEETAKVQAHENDGTADKRAGGAGAEPETGRKEGKPDAAATPPAGDAKGQLPGSDDDGKSA